MIVFISKSDFLDNYKKLTKSGQYGIINGTENEEIMEMGAVKNSMEDFSCLDASEALIKGKLDKYRWEKKLKKWLSTPAMHRVAAIAAALQLSEDGDMKPNKKLNKNVFVVFPNKVYQKLAKHVKARWLKIYKLEEGTEGVVVLFDKLTIETNESDAVSDEIGKIDKKIDKLVSNLSAGMDAGIWADTDIERTEKRITKLRKERKKLKEGKTKGTEYNSLRVKILKNDAAIGKKARKKLNDYIVHYHKHSGSDAYLNREY